jgi:hypothetical protein
MDKYMVAVAVVVLGQALVLMMLVLVVLVVVVEEVITPMVMLQFMDQERELLIQVVEVEVVEHKATVEETDQHMLLVVQELRLLLI